MKNLFYIDGGQVMQILSDAMSVRNEDGHDDIIVVVCTVNDQMSKGDKVNTEIVWQIGSVYQSLLEAELARDHP